MTNGRVGSVTRILPSLDVVTSLVALSGLLPVAGGLPSIASVGDGLTDGIWITVNLGGGLLLLAGGLKLLLPKVSFPRFVAAYVISIAALGTLRLQLLGFHKLVSGWLLLAVCVAALLLMLHRPWVWSLVGATWCVLLLGLWSTGGVMSYLSASSPQFPFFVPLQMLACVLALALLAAHLRYRASVAG
jgi:hypothetical protein